MREALALAERGRGFTSPNPRVGAVIVRDGQVVGRGYHEAFGAAHAEVNAIAEAGERTRGADVYVTLEPCCVWGKTPPCTDALIEAGVRRVVVPVCDPNPDVAGRGLSILRDAGVLVETGCLEDEARLLNEPYFRYRATGLPAVTIKLAVTIDGRLTGGVSSDRWVTSETSRRRVHAMRGASDAVLVGVGTVLADDPQLTDRRGAARRQPARVIADSRLSTPARSALLREAGPVRTILCCVESPETVARAAQLTERGAEIWYMEAGSDGRVDMTLLLRRLADDGMTDILCEGGATIATRLLDESLVTRVAFFIAPRMAGAAGVPALRALRAPTGLCDVSWEAIDRDALMTARVEPHREEQRDAGRCGATPDRNDIKDVTTCSQD